LRHCVPVWRLWKLSTYARTAAKLPTDAKRTVITGAVLVLREGGRSVDESSSQRQNRAPRMAVLRCYATNRAAVSSALSRRSRRHARSVVHAASTNLTSELELALQQLDKHLSAVRAEGDDAESIESERLAITLAAQLREQQQLRGYGSGKLAPKRDYTLADLRLNKIEPEQLLSPRDVTLEGVRNMAILALASGVAAAATALQPSTEQLLAGGVALAFLAGIDQVGNNGALESVAVDALGRVVSPTYSARVARHEAGHFLIAYLCGILPRAYTLSALDAFRRYRAGNVQAGTLFCDAAFRAEVASGKLTASSLDAFTCIALAGVAS